MIREYKTIAEVAGPLMLVKGVEDVSYDELGEIELPNGEIRHCQCSGDQRHRTRWFSCLKVLPVST